jgi:hypothetical protein
MGALEEAAKATGGFIETMRSQPLVLMMGLMNIGLLLFLFYYLSRITARTENTVAALFTANDKLYSQWGTVIKDQQLLTEKVMHCILPEDALKLLQTPSRSIERPAQPRNLHEDPPKPQQQHNISDPTGLIIPIPVEPPETSACTPESPCPKD